MADILVGNHIDLLGLSLKKVGSVELVGQILVAVTTINSATYNLLVKDNLLHVNYTTTGQVAITLPTAQAVNGRAILVKDSGGNSSNNSITIGTEGSETIDGEATFIINSDYDVIRIYSDGTNWFLY